jgi:hypothetical protein
MSLGLALDQGYCTGAALFHKGKLLEARPFFAKNPDLPLSNWELFIASVQQQSKDLWRWLHDKQMDLGESIDRVVMEEFQRGNRREKTGETLVSVKKLYFRTGYLRATLELHLPISCQFSSVNKMTKSKKEAAAIVGQVGYTGKNKDVIDAVYHGVLGGLYVE